MNLRISEKVEGKQCNWLVTMCKWLMFDFFCDNYLCTIFDRFWNFLLICIYPVGEHVILSNGVKSALQSTNGETHH